ncbi:MAG TPA: O-antigen ligase family protein [Thermoanaerobaculia bacterium]|jgi:O-antigen ligase|nr:O-antigen ligase family protein [Thermoanaerobaculia bacterium]
MIRHSGSALTALLTLLILWAPLPFASATPWAVAILQTGCFIALALAAAALRDGRRLRPALLPAAALAAVALLAFLQSLPWPAFAVSFLSPQHAAVAVRAAALPQVAVEHLYLSLAPGASQAAAMQWAALAAALLAGAAAGWRATRRWVAGAVILGGIFQTFFGARAQYVRAPTLWGVDVPRSPRLHGTFVNPNHLALFLEIALCVVSAWGWWALRRTRDDEQPERRILFLAGPVLCALTLLTGLVLSGSRAGLLAAAAAVTVQSVAAAAARRRWQRAVWGVGVALCGLGLVVAGVGAREGLGRFIDTRAGDVSFQGRLTEYRAVLHLWSRFPVLGTGVGSFHEAFPLVQPAALQGTWWHAHSDLLELAATGGLLGLALVLAGGVPVVRRLLILLRSRSRSEDRAAALAILGCLAAAGFHELLDFGLTMPANAVTLAVLTGAALGTQIRHVAPLSPETQRTRRHRPAGHGLELDQVDAPADRQAGDERSSRARRRRTEQRPVEP